MNGPASGSIADGAHVITNEMETNMSSVAQHTELAKQGMRLFPLAPGLKKPMSNGWRAQATNDVDQVRDWAVQGLNLGIATGSDSDLYVLDIDTKGAVNGFDTLAELEAQYGDLPQTLTVMTPSGGEHLYFRMPRMAGVWTINQGQPGPGLDFRADDGLVVAPGSELDGKVYKVIKDVQIAPCPDWLAEKTKRKPRQVMETIDDVVFDGDAAKYDSYTAESIKAIIEPLQECRRQTKPNGEGYTGPAWERSVFEAAGDLVSLANSPWNRLTHERAREILLSYAPTDEGFTAEMVAQKYANAVARKNGEVRKIPVLHTDTTAAMEDWIAADAAQQKLASEALPAPSEPSTLEDGSPRGTFIRERLLSRSGLRNMPKGEPLIGDGVLFRRTVALCAGYHGTGKSFVALDWAASIATGLPWQGCSVRKGKVLYIIGEGAIGIDERLAAWEAEHATAIPDESFMVVNGAPQLKDDAHMAELHWLIKAERYDLVVIDTMARSTVRLEENSAKDMGEVIAFVDEIKEALDGGTVLLVHHTGKDKATVRGSSALEAAMDTVHITSGHVKTGITLEHTKNKYGPDGTKRTMSLVLHGSSGALRAQTAAQAEVAEAAALETTVEGVFRILAEHPEQSLAGGRYRDICMEAFGIDERTWQRAVKQLKGNASQPSTVRVKNVGAANRPQYVVVGDIEAGRV